MDPQPSTAGREWRFRLLLLALSAVFTFAVGEVALRLLERGAPKPVASESGFSFFTHDPRLGWDLVPGAVDQHKTAEFAVEIRIDEQGLRSPISTPVELSAEQAGALRLAVLGDSFTFGHGVEAHEAWPALLDERLPSLEAHNLAVTGYGTDQQLLRFEERAAELAPDAVILGLFAGTVFRHARFEQLGYAKPRFAFDGSELRLLGVPVPDGPPSKPSSRLWALLSGTLRSVTEHLGYGEAWTVTGGILDRLAVRAGEHDAPLFIVILPKDRMVYGGGPRQSVHERMHARLHRLLDERGLEYLDLTSALRDGAKDQPRLYYARDGHWTPDGHRVAAEAIADWLAPLLPAPVLQTAASPMAEDTDADSMHEEAAEDPTESAR